MKKKEWRLEKFCSVTRPFSIFAHILEPKTELHTRLIHKNEKTIEDTKHDKQTNKAKDYIHKVGSNPRLLLKVLFQMFPIDRKSANLLIQILEMISVVAKLLTNNKWSDLKGLELSVFPLLFVGFVPLQYKVSHT